MRYLLLIILIISSTFIYAQNNNVNTNITIKNASYLDNITNQRKKQGTYYLGNGQYYIIRIGNSFKLNVNKMEKEALEIAEQLVLTYEAASYKKMQVDKTKAAFGSFAEVKVTVLLLDENNNPIVPKEEAREIAKNKIIELKSLLDSGIITQEEFNKSAEKYKKILLDN